MTEKRECMLSYNSHIFLEYDGIKSIWKCNQYFKIKCHGRVHLSDGKMLKKTYQTQPCSELNRR